MRILLPVVTAAVVSLPSLALSQNGDDVTLRTDRASHRIDVTAPLAIDYTSVTIRSLEFNTDALEYAPTITADGRTLYYCSNRPDGLGGHDIWRVTKDDAGTFVSPTNLPAPVNTELNEGAASIAPDGRTIFFTGCLREDSQGDCDIYSAELVNNEFVNIQNVTPVNSMHWETMPTVSPDGGTLYFISNRPGATGGNGDIDIYVSTREQSGVWGAPRNLGAPINTSKREDSPFLHSSGELLYFGSAGHGGEGGLDFFVSRRDGDGWAAPVNLGKPINSSLDERFITVPASGNEIYFSSSRTDVPNAGGLDIFVATIPPQSIVALIRGRAFDAATGSGLVANLIFTDAATGEILSSTRSRVQTGAYSLAVSASRSSRVRAQGVAAGYREIDDTIDITAADQYVEIEHDFRFTAGSAGVGDDIEIHRTSIVVVPNPAADRINISSAQPGATHELSVFDAYGHRIQSHSFDGSSIELDVHEYANGIYLVNIDGVTVPFVVQR